MKSIKIPGFLKSGKNIAAGIAMLAVLGGSIGYYVWPEQMTVETGSYTLEERQAIADEVKDYLVEYVVSDGFVNEVGESEDLKALLAEKIAAGEIVLLNEEQIDEIAQYAVDNYNALLGSNIDSLTDEQIKALEESIRNNIAVTIGDTAESKEEDVNTMTGGVSTIIIKNIMAQLDKMNESIEQLQSDLNTIKENIALGASFSDISSSIGQLEERLEYVKENLSEEDQALASDISDIEEDLRTLHVNVDETATVVVQLESTMDDLTKSNLDSLNVQISDTLSAIDKINKDYQSILDKINNLQSSMSSKDTELSNIAKDAATKVNDLSGLLSALQKEFNNYKSATDKALKNMQDTQTVLDKNLSSYKDTTNKSLTDLFTGQESTNKSLSGYKDTTNKSLVDLFTGQESTDKNLSDYKNETNTSLTDLQNEQTATNKNLSDYQDITDADITNIYSIINNLQTTQNTNETDLTEIKNKLKSLDDQMTQVFTSVSSGKASLASALTGKGVTTDAVATFNTLTDNIKGIGASANAVSPSLLTGYTAYVGNKYITGSMANQGAVTAVLNCGQIYSIPSGYHNGSGKITANSLESQTQATATANNLSAGATGWVNGRLITGNGADNQAAYDQGYNQGLQNAVPMVITQLDNMTYTTQGTVYDETSKKNKFKLDYIFDIASVYPNYMTLTENNFYFCITKSEIKHYFANDADVGDPNPFTFDKVYNPSTGQLTIKNVCGASYETDTRGDGTSGMLEFKIIEFKLLIL